jgi:hypothetical protein
MANERIRSRRAAQAQAGGEQAGALLPESFAYLTLDEVLAVRLYSGPAYQPINGFLRSLGHVHGEYRSALARDTNLTFMATVGHLCRAIRKLAAVTTPAEASKPLYRGVRGELPRTFWVPDEQGMVCAVETAFMSTSRNRSTPVAYMGEGTNVLWELQARTASDAAFHRGADISMLSQFAQEDECLFPPCTMLEVLRSHDQRSATGEAAAAKGEASARPAVIGRGEQGELPPHVAAATAMVPLAAQLGLSVREASEGGRSFLAINALPSFI